MSNSNSSGGTGGSNPRRVRIDDALSGWPAPERSTLEWDESAEAVMARLGGPARDTDVSDEALLAPPLAAEPGEVQGSAPVERQPARAEASMNTTSSRQRDRASLQELAKMASETPAPPGAGRVSRPSYPGVAVTGGTGTPEAKEPTPPPQPVAEREENSGIINLAALAAEEKPAESAPVAASASAATSAPRRAKAGAAAAPKAARGSILYVFGTLATAAAVAAGVFIGMRRPANEMSAPIAAVPAPVQATPAPVATTQPGVAVAATDKAVDPSTLPEAVATGGAQAAPSTPAGAKPVAAAAPAAATATGNAPDPKLVAVVPTATAPAGSGKSLEALMQQAAGVTSSPTAPAATASDDGTQATAPGSVPLRPSTGAVRGALGAVTPGARACLDPDDAVSHAMVTFQSDGSVQNVTVSGSAAGKPAEACIRTALSRARIPAFASPTFSAPVTIRPN
jgi:hypothetical protein